jgi:hypothetical protein
MIVSNCIIMKLPLLVISYFARKDFFGEAFPEELLRRPSPKKGCTVFLRSNWRSTKDRYLVGWASEFDLVDRTGGVVD